MIKYATEQDDQGIYYVYEFGFPLTKATVTDFVTGISATGYARLHETDKYDQGIGKSLALGRAARRYYKKLEKWTIKNLVECQE